MDTGSSLNERFAPALASLSASTHPEAAEIQRKLQEVIAARPSSTMAQWCRDHHGQAVHTIQINNKSGEIWSPLNRVIDAQSYSTKALFDSSAREYARMHVLAALSDALIVADDWHTVAYVVAG